MEDRIIKFTKSGNKNSKVLLIYGPTATGKTSLAINLAKRINGEIISADSRQVYKGLDIGTGKVSFESNVEKHKGYWIADGVKIHGFDLINPEKRFTAADFLKFANDSIIQITKQNRLPIIVGGTGFYIKALLYGIASSGIKPDWKLRRQLEKMAVPDLYRKLKEQDSSRVKNINESDRQNPRRLIRAIEISMHAKNAASTDLTIQQPNYLIIGLTASNEFLYKKADQWLNDRLEHGMIKEVESLIGQGVSTKWLEGLGLEYRWITRYMQKKITKNQMVERLKGEIHGFIRRQKTWFKQLNFNCQFDISQHNWQNELEKKINNWLSLTKT